MKEETEIGRMFECFHEFEMVLVWSGLVTVIYLLLFVVQHHQQKQHKKSEPTHFNNSEQHRKNVICDIHIL